MSGVSCQTCDGPARYTSVSDGTRSSPYNAKYRLGKQAAFSDPLFCPQIGRTRSTNGPPSPLCRRASLHCACRRSSGIARCPPHVAHDVAASVGARPLTTRRTPLANPPACTGGRRHVLRCEAGPRGGHQPSEGPLQHDVLLERGHADGAPLPHVAEHAEGQGRRGPLHPAALVSVWVSVVRKLPRWCGKRRAPLVSQNRVLRDSNLVTLFGLVYRSRRGGPRVPYLGARCRWDQLSSKSAPGEPISQLGHVFSGFHRGLL